MTGGGGGGVKKVQIFVTSFMNDPQGEQMLLGLNFYHKEPLDQPFKAAAVKLLSHVQSVDFLQRCGCFHISM